MLLLRHVPCSTLNGLHHVLEATIIIRQAHLDEVAR
jgi:hypothetical protein